MKKTLKEHSGLFILLVLVLINVGLIGYKQYHDNIEANEITQEVNAMESIKGTQIYLLTTLFGDKVSYDFGTEAQILELKCQRYSEFEKYRIKYIANKKAEKLAKEKKEQAIQEALDRLNKPCN